MSIQAPAFDNTSPSAIRDRFHQLYVRASGRIKLGMHAEFTRYGLSRNLAVPFSNPSAKIPITVRPLQTADLSALFSLEGCNDPAESLQVAWRRSFVDKGARRGFVAIDQRNDTPCYVQWLLGADDNAFIKRLSGFPMLGPQQALLENAFTPIQYRGFGIMSAAMALIAERAADFGAREVITFVDHDNIASLKGCQRAGFYPDQLHHRTRLAFGLITRDWFEPLPAADSRRTLTF